MPFETLINTTQSKKKTPALGVRMGTRGAAGRGADPTRYIYLYLGNVLASDLSMSKAEHKCHVMVGTGVDRGQIAFKLHDATGDFTAKRQKDGCYKLTIRAAAFEGRLKDDFEEYTVEEATKVHGTPTMPGGKPPLSMITFRTGMGVLVGLPDGKVL